MRDALSCSQSCREQGGALTLNSAMDVAIGLILMYLVLSLVCTTVNEYIATAMKLRAKTLASGLQQLIDDPVLHQTFSSHGLIDGVQQVVGKRMPSYVDGKAFAMAVLGSLDQTKPVPGFGDIQQALQHMPDSNIRDTLLAHVATAQGDLQKLRDNVASWFDGAMDRVSGIYKQDLKVISLLVGLGVAIVLNADSLAVGKALWNDPTLRAQITEAARNTKEPTNAAALAQATASFEQLRPLPIGWDPHPPKFPTNEAMVWFWVQKAFGFLVTGIALSLGAPFWFDLLSKVMNVRGAGEKPKRTGEAAS